MDDGKDDGQAEGNKTWVEDEDKDKSVNMCIVVVPSLLYRGRCRNITLPLNSIK